MTSVSNESAVSGTSSSNGGQNGQKITTALLKKRPSDSDGNYNTLSNDNQIDMNKPDPQVVDIVSRHLVKDSDNLQLKSGDMTRDIYKWTSEHPISSSSPGDTMMNSPQMQQDAQPISMAQRRRSISFSGASAHSSGIYSSTRNSEFELPPHVAMTHEEIRAPGGFRRSFIVRKHERKYGNNAPPPNFLTRNFIEFLTLYGHFAGEDLEEEEDEDEEGTEQEGRIHERTDLLERGQVSETDTAEVSDHRHKTSTFKAVLLLLKSFVGTGVLFLPKGFENGGWGFSVLCLLFCAIASFYCFVILISAKDKVGVSGYGDLGAKLYGSKVKFAILFSIAISQIGFAAAYIVFTSTNLKVFAEHVFGVKKDSLGLAFYIALQTVIFIPLAFTRNISKLSGTTLIADLFILLGLLYVYYYPVYYIIENGLASDSMVFLNKNDWSLFVGTAIFTFEGIGLLIPIQESMAHREKFQPCLSGVLCLVAFIFISTGLICYSAFGSDVETVVLLNFPQNSPFTKSVQLLYATAILLSTPLQLFPAIRILENWSFPTNASGKHNPRIKWLKNYFRSGVVIITALVAWAGANDLDKFVSIVGSSACIPLIYIYPPLLHHRAFKNDSRFNVSRSFDILIAVFGTLVMLYITYQTIVLWGS
ncbi:hypothetical protein HG535_0A04890 [Zygotorulaspora mrakii]|uniref:Amino acid transporter transmembrane domain-containing protein n=1 Tax=Zygotorulaspora mrakii TaxID=42260 RepID=A0A7H9AVY9_ZYGMR|nr:uncharacterized protein HG535_0A04890 [Zygotorulaspora mrakii]QLG70548.1 hypothetical protein HG535_0A04890 [Zygotorulaspora mrakii]